MSESKKKIDKLDRKDYIKFIENLILNSDNYKRDNDSKAYVMALDSAWGTGKSYFIDLLIQDIEERNDIFVVKYNAWINDYCDNAFNPLIYDILNADCLKFSTETDADRENVKNLIKSAFNVGAIFAKKIVNDAIKNKTGFDVEKVLDKAIKSGKDIKNFMIREIPNIAELNEQRETFANFKKYLSNATEWMQESGKKLVVIVDELDRCKPTFAIQTLEIVKHIFDVENIVFLFAVDIEQLSHSVSSVYGQDFDSVGYLCRFFDYISKLPNPKIEQYLSQKLGDAGFDRQNPNIIQVHGFVSALTQGFNLSLRDIDTVMQSYKILYDTKLKDYNLIDVQMVYLFYLFLKYKHPNLYYRIFIDKSEDCDTLQELMHKSIFNIYDNKYLTASFNALLDDEILFNVKKDLCISENNLHQTILIGSVDKDALHEQNSNQIYHIIPKTSWGDILFYSDLKKWSDICIYTYREYIHKQLENYNFVNTESDDEL